MYFANSTTKSRKKLRFYKKEWRQRGVNLPAAVLRLVVNNIVIYDFGDSAADVIHPKNPLHLVLSLEFFSYALFFGKVFYYPKEHILCLLVDFGKQAIQLSTRQKIGVKHLTVLLEIA